MPRREEYSDVETFDEVTSEVSEEDSEEYEDSGSESDEVYADDDPRNCIVEDIDDTFARAKVGDFDLIMMKENGYVNATKLCRECGKDFADWYTNKSTKKFINTVKRCADITAHLVVKKLKGVTNSLKGTYVHSDLIINVAQWCDPEYAYKVTKVMWGYHAKKAIEAKEALLKKKDDKIDKLTKLVEKQREEQKREREEQKRERETQKREIAELLKLAREQGIELKRNTTVLEENNEKIEHMTEVLEEIAEDRVVKGKPRNAEVLLVVENNCPKRDQPDNYYAYKVFRVAKRSKKTRLNSHKVVYPDAEIIFEVDQPNSVNLWQRFSDKYNGKKIKTKGCDFNLIRPCTKKTLLRLLNRMHEERLDYD